MRKKTRTVICFPDGHAWQIATLRAGLIVLLGNYKFKTDGPKNGAEQVIWTWDQAELQFYINSAQAGQAIISVFGDNPKLEQIILQWQRSDTVKMPEPGREYH